MVITTTPTKDGKNVLLSWTPVPGCMGYVFFRDGVRVANTWDPSRSSIKFSTTDGLPHTYGVDAIDNGDLGTVKYPSGTFAPDAVVPPSPYKVPSGGIVATDGPSLIRAIDTNPSCVILADGTYDSSSVFLNRNAIPLYAQHLGKAILTAGIEGGGNYAKPGALLQGLVIDVKDPSKAATEGSVLACVASWGSGTGFKLYDTVLKGNKVLEYGFYTTNPIDADLQRLQVYGFTDNGIMLHNNQKVPYGSTTPIVKNVTDILVDGVVRPVPGSSNGTAEAGLFLGHPILNLDRIKLRNCYWSGIETCDNSWDTTYSNLDIDMTGLPGRGTGFYMEHFNFNNIIRASLIKVADGAICINSEWDYGQVDNGSKRNTVRDSVLIGGRLAINLDEGTESSTVNNVMFEGQTIAAIGEYLNNKTPGTFNTYMNNDYSKLAKGAVPVSTSHG